MIIIKKISKRDKLKAEKFSKKEWKSFNKERSYVFRTKKYQLVAKDGNKIVGYADFEITGGASLLDQLIIKKNYRRNKVGESLLKKFEEISRKNGAHILYLETSKVHKEALNFYRKNGYKKLAMMKNFKFHFDWYILAKEVTK